MIATKITKTKEKQYKTTIPLKIIEGLENVETVPYYIVWKVDKNKFVTATIGRVK